jgi:predicted metalloprotease with PDZ domain
MTTSQPNLKTYQVPDTHLYSTNSDAASGSKPHIYSQREIVETGGILSTNPHQGWIQVNKLTAALLLSTSIAATTVAHAEAKNGTVTPRDVPYSGTLTLNVDATDLARRIFRVHETIPVKSGNLVLQFPEWVPGGHTPRNPIDQIAGLIIQGNGKRVEWTRDPYDMFSFHVRVPEGVKDLEVDLQFLSPTTDQGRTTMTPQILGVQWLSMMVYPAGYYMRGIQVQPNLTLPSGWSFATALDGAKREGDAVHFAVTPLDTLFDSPLFAGQYSRTIELATVRNAPVRLDIFADSPEELSFTPEQLAAHRKLVLEADTLFNSRHFDHYDFLFSISDRFGGIGLEHHRSSEDGVKAGYFKDYARSEPERDLLAHEMTHSWNGKFRRPADLWTPTLNVPMADSLLWVYEGQTQYWGYVLAARAGLISPETTRSEFAYVAATLQDSRAGRSWRDLQDTNNQPIIGNRRSQSWASYQRAEDYYIEGALIWLDVDTCLREMSNGKVSLDDFARTFFSVNDGSYVTLTYRFEDIVKALNQLVPNDWTSFLRSRLDSYGPGAPLQGIERSGWRLVYRDTQPSYLKKVEDLTESVNRSWSLGIVLDKEGKMNQVVWGSPAYEAGLTTGTSLIAVNGVAYKKELLDQALMEARDHHQPIQLLVRNMNLFRTVSLSYTGGPRYPELERIDGTPDRLADILKSRTGSP